MYIIDLDLVLKVWTQFMNEKNQINPFEYMTTSKGKKKKITQRTLMKKKKKTVETLDS